MKTVRGIVIAVMLLAAGCSGYRQQATAPGAYLNHQSFSYLAFDWNMSRQADGIQVAGIVRNINYLRLRDLDLTVSALDANDQKVGEGTYLFRAVLIDIGDTLPFELYIPVRPGRSTAKLLFVTRYRPDDRDAVETIDSQSFEVRLP